MKQLTIGILVTNTDNSAFAQSHPRDGEKFTALLRAVRPAWTYRVYDCTNGEFPARLDECDGYVIGGSPASVNDDDAWIGQLLELIRDFDAARTPVVGCCFGHQAIAKALGGEVGRNPEGWGFGVSPTHFTTKEPWMSPPAPVLNLFAAHNEQVTKVPLAARVVGGDAFCPAASLMVGDHFLTTEYHPEITRDFFIGLTRAFESYIGSEVAAEARAQAEKPTDNAHFAEWMAKFLDSPR
jgi:GMP synthase-like glutamine amidotransferase